MAAGRDRVSGMTRQPARRVAAANITENRRVDPQDTLGVTALAIGIFSVLFLQRFAFNIAGYPLQLVQLVVLAVLAYLVWRRVAQLDLARLIGFLLMLGVLAVEGLITHGRGSMTSLGLLLVIYVLSTLVVPMSRASYVELLRRFQLMMLITAVLGVGQFFGQFVLPAEYLFSFQHFVPSGLLLPGFNTMIPVSYGSSLFKSNGFVFLEPSTFSQYLALAIIIELAVFRSGRRLAAFSLAYLFTYSGTGLIILAAALPLFAGGLRARHLLAGATFIGVVLVFSGSVLNLDVFLDRASSFNDEHSSAFARFVGPWWWIRDVQMDDPLAMFFGFGPGAVEGLRAASDFHFHDPTWAKVIMEYGLIGACVFFSFFLYSLFSRAYERRLNWGLLVMFGLTGGALLNPFMACGVLLLGAVPVREAQADLGDKRAAQDAPPRFLRTPGAFAPQNLGRIR